MSDLVLVDRPAEGVVVITLNRPEARNALSMALREQASRALRDAGADESVGAVVLTGAGSAFCAGVDLKELGTPGGSPKPSAPGSENMVAAILECSVPVIAAVNGLAITGGLEVVIACDIVLASASARFADTHARVGILPLWGMTQRLPRLIGMQRAKQLSFSGDFCDAETAQRWGLVNRVVEPDQLLTEAMALASAIAANDRRAVRNLKRVYDEGALVTMAEGLALERARGREHLTGVKPQDIADRRAALQARNRQQAAQ